MEFENVHWAWPLLNAELTVPMTVLLCVVVVSAALVLISFTVSAAFFLAHSGHRSVEYRVLTGPGPPRPSINWQPLGNVLRASGRALRRSSKNLEQGREHGERRAPQQAA